MQYDLKTIGKESLVKIKWHGVPTRVLLEGEAVKRDVATGDVLEVTVNQARQLVSMNRLFTLDGDEPMYQAPQVFAPSAEEVKKAEESGELTLAMAEKLEKKKDIVDALKGLDVSFNATGASAAELKALLIETLTEKATAPEKEPEADDKKPEDGVKADANAPKEDDKTAKVSK